MFTIKNSNSGLTSQEVMACEDIGQLHRWKQEQLLDVAFIKLQYSFEKNYVKTHGEPKDEHHYHKLKTAKRLQGTLYTLIEERINELREQKDSTKDAILNIVKENMEEEKWRLLVEEASLGKQSTFGTS